MNGEPIKDGVIYVYSRGARSTVAQALRNMKWRAFTTLTADSSRTHQYRSRDALIYDGVPRDSADPRYVIAATRSEMDALMREIDRLIAVEGYEGRGIDAYLG